MPRTARAMVAGGCYHLINRGNNRATVFRSRGEYASFVDLIGEAQRRIPIELFSVCLMPNHFHAVARIRQVDDLSRWVQWLLTTHAHRFHLGGESVGRVWQGRFKAFPIEQDTHLLTVMRYVERNPLRAGLVRRAEDWEWNSLAWRFGDAQDALLADPPVRLPGNWTEYVNAPQTVAELDDVRNCLNRQRPYGSEGWVRESTELLGLQGSIRPRGRPMKAR